MSDPFRWPALAGAAALLGETIQAEIGIWGKVHRQASDYRWIARSRGFGGTIPDLHRRLRIGREDRAVRAVAWRAPWTAGGQDYFAIGCYPSRALDAANRGGVLEKQVLHWRRPDAGLPVVLAALVLLPVVARADDGLWWDRVAEGDWQRPDYALPLGPDACPRVRVERAALESAIDQGIDALLEVLDQPRLTAVYADLLRGVRPVMLRGLEAPLPPAALAALLLPLAPRQAEHLSLCAWVPSMLIDPPDLGHNWDLAVTQQSDVAMGLVPDLAPEFADPGAALAQALLTRDPGRIDAWTRSVVPGHGADRVGAGGDGPRARPERSMAGDPNPRLHLGPDGAADWPGFGYLHAFAQQINLRRLDLSRLAQDLAAPTAYPLLKPGEDPAGHPLIGWIETLSADCPAGVDLPEWGFKIDQLRAAALFLLPHPDTLGLVGLPEHPRVPALLAVLTRAPEAAAGLAAHGEAALRQLWEHTQACPDAPLVADLRDWMTRWLAATGDPGVRR